MIITKFNKLNMVFEIVISRVFFDENEIAIINLMSCSEKTLLWLKLTEWLYGWIHK